jgi:hypothetical protein
MALIYAWESKRSCMLSAKLSHEPVHIDISEYEHEFSLDFHDLMTCTTALGTYFCNNPRSVVFPDPGVPLTCSAMNIDREHII